MKFICLYLLVLAPIILIGQQTGKYCHNYNGLGFECISLLENKKFKYSFDHCTGNDFGQGVYVLDNNRLILNFQSDSTLEANKILKEKNVANSDSILIKIKIFDSLSKKPISGVNVTIQMLDGEITGQSTDSIGYLIIKMLNQNSMATLLINGDIYDVHSDQIILNQDYNYVVYLVAQEGKIYQTGESKVFYIRSRTKKLLMKDNNWDNEYREYFFLKD